ncbi:MAG: NAD(P)H dehydrogenase [Angelakisella sp.]
MNTIVLNGSPKKNMKESNSELFAKYFIGGMKAPCELKHISQSSPVKLAEHIRSFDTVIIIFPLYIHAMPGSVMRFFEELRPVEGEGKSLGFIIQAGFSESAQERFVLPYLEQMAKDLGYNYLGTVVKGEAAAVAMYPEGFAKVLKQVEDLGRKFAETHAFDPEIVKQLGKPYTLSGSQLFFLNIACKLGITNFFWHKTMKQHNAYEKRLDRPYL